MTRRRRTRVLVDGDPSLRRELAREVRERYGILDVEPPHHAMVMMKVREPARRTLFYLGEVLVSEAKVQIGEAVGIGILVGDQLEAAADLAVIDAACNADVPETGTWTERLQAEEGALEARLARRQAAVLQTRVRFESMDTE